MNDLIGLGLVLVSTASVAFGFFTARRRAADVRQLEGELADEKLRHLDTQKLYYDAEQQLAIAKRNLSSETKRTLELISENEKLAALIDTDGRIRRLDAFKCYRVLVMKDHDFLNAEELIVGTVRARKDVSFRFTHPWEVARARAEWPHTARSMARRFAREIYGRTVADWEEQIVEQLAPLHP